jgi:hypothetical protein
MHPSISIIIGEERMSRKDKEKWAKFRREQARALMAKGPSQTESVEGITLNPIGRRRARRYARQNEDLAMAQEENSLENELPLAKLSETGDACPFCAERLGPEVTKCPACGGTVKSEEEATKLSSELAVPLPVSEASAQPESSTTEKVTVSDRPLETSPSPGSLKERSDEPYHTSTDLARDMERLAEERRRNDDMLEKLEKRRQIVSEQADRVSKKARKDKGPAGFAWTVDDETSRNQD